MPLITDWISAIAAIFGALVGVGALVAVLAVRKQVKLQRKQLKLDLENVYLVRYWAIMDDLLTSKPESVDRRRHIARYLRLSEDQCDLRYRGRITASTWNYWRLGMLEQLGDPEFSRVFNGGPPDLFDHLRGLERSAVYDPAASRPANSAELRSE